MSWLAGVDGCRAGWFRVCRERGTGALRFDVVASARDLAFEPPAPAVIAIDVPIGLPERGARECDRAARRVLGPRRSSVFPAPVRAAIAAPTREEASRITSGIDGRRVGVQAWGIFGKIREVDALLQAEPALREVFREVHPEVSFCAWNDGRPMRAAKRDRRGRAQRIALAEAWLGKDILARARGAHLEKDLADDDVLDAIAALWTAHRIAAGDATVRPDPPPLDATGLRMEIVS